MFRKKRRVNSMSDLPSSRNNPSNLRRRNSISYDDVQSYERWRQQDDLNQSRSTSLSTKKYSMYTGLSPKEKIEYNDYHDVRYAYNIDKNAKIFRGDGFCCCSHEKQHPNLAEFSFVDLVNKNQLNSMNSICYFGAPPLIGLRIILFYLTHQYSKLVQTTHINT